MKLEVGMYVRTKKGIAKYLGLGRDVLVDDKSNQFRNYANQHLFDNYIFEVEHDWGDTLSAKEFKNIDKYIEQEPSYNPIDLIEEGDYVNGLPVTRICIDDETNEKYLNMFGSISEYESEDIKSIVTKERFDSMKYEVDSNE